MFMESACLKLGKRTEYLQRKGSVSTDLLINVTKLTGFCTAQEVCCSPTLVHVFCLQI